MRIALAILLACVPALAQSSTLDHALDGPIQAALAASGAPSVSVAVVQNGRIAYAKAFGKADLEANKPATTETRYAIGSVSKQFTAAALLLLQEEGKLSIDDKVAKYFPELTRANEITIRQLLSHTSGYEDYAPQDYIIPEWEKPTTSRAIMDRWGRKPLNFDPGTRYQYSNTGYVIAAGIAEKVSGQPLVDFLRARIFGPLGMTSAGDCSVRVPNDATPYTRFALGPPRKVGREGAGWYNGAGELCMTPSDVAKWDIAFIDRRILSPRSYEEFTREVKLANGGSTRYGLGLTIRDIAGAPAFAHGGEVSGFLTSSTVLPARRAAVVVCSNEDGVNLIESIAQMANRAVTDQNGGADRLAQQVQDILTGLQQGKFDRALFTSNANAYFTDQALADYGSSLTALGPLKSVTKTGEGLRGGMTHLSYRAQFEKKTVTLNIYRTNDGKFEQFMVMEQF